MANVMWSWLRACSIVSEQTLWLCALLGLFVYFCALFCELLAAHTELRFTAVCVALFSGFVYAFLIGALVRLRGMDGILQPQLSLPKLRLRPSARVNGRNAG